jgi:hypothetical protein
MTKNKKCARPQAKSTFFVSKSFLVIITHA